MPSKAVGLTDAKIRGLTPPSSGQVELLDQPVDSSRLQAGGFEGLRHRGAPAFRREGLRVCGGNWGSCGGIWGAPRGKGVAAGFSAQRQGLREARLLGTLGRKAEA